MCITSFRRCKYLTKVRARNKRLNHDALVVTMILYHYSQTASALIALYLILSLSIIVSGRKYLILIITRYRADSICDYSVATAYDNTRTPNIEREASKFIYKKSQRRQGRSELSSHFCGIVLHSVIRLRKRCFLEPAAN